MKKYTRTRWGRAAVTPAEAEVKYMKSTQISIYLLKKHNIKTRTQWGRAAGPPVSTVVKYMKSTQISIHFLKKHNIKTRTAAWGRAEAPPARRNISNKVF